MKTNRKIAYQEYQSSFVSDPHVFLVGDLKKTSDHPFVRDDRFEFIICSYKSGDHGKLHWHLKVDEFEIVTEGRIGYFFVETGRTEWYSAGDFSYIPAGCCVKRIVNESARTIAVKIPSNAGKVDCIKCDRECTERIEAYHLDDSEP